MQLEFTIASPGSGRPAVDVAVQAPTGATLSSVLDRLLSCTGFDGPVYVGQSLLPAQAPLGRPPLTTGAVLAIGRAAPAPTSPPALLQLRVVGGPDAGGVHRLPRGEHRVGRAADAAISLRDPDVSRSHAVLSVEADAVTVRDAGSTNGTAIDGRQVAGAPVPLMAGALLQIGESTLCLAGPDEPPTPLRPDGQGHLEVNRPPRLARMPPQVAIDVPDEPGAIGRSAFPLLAVVVPLVFGAVMVRLMHSWTFALFMLLSPLLLATNAVSDRVTGRRNERRARTEHRRASAAVAARTDQALAAEAAQRRAEFPDAAALLQAVSGPLPRLWERRGGDVDALVLRLGTGDLTARLTVGSPASDAPPQHPDVAAVPVTVSLREVGVLGLTGPVEQVAGMARYLVGQLAGLHSPRQLDLVLLCASDSDRAASWRWARWLPHLRDPAGGRATLRLGLTPAQTGVRVAECTALLAARQLAGPLGPGRGWLGPATVLVVDGARSVRSTAGVARLLEEGPAVGIYALCLAGDPLELPVECGATVALTGETATRLRLCRAGVPPVEAVADLVSPAWARTLSRALAPLTDATPDGTDAALPTSARLVDLLDAVPDAERILGAWQAAPRCTTALLGVGVGGPFSVDLRRDGPHALVAGTTGAGKSELLQTFIASLALANRPDECVFVLVDYKGGAAFAECARLPHTVGMVTDLDGHLTQRALSSLDAELKTRERTLRSAACKDIDDYVRAGRPHGPMPRLVMVIDEFASLAAELPDFVTGLVDIARRGRSLGVHLVLATQRPGGVVSADIRANTNLRIALRVTDPAESADVIEVTDAALISRSIPGRALCRTGAGDVAPLQVARVGGPVVRAEPAPAVRVLSWATRGDPDPDPEPPADGGSTDLGLLAEELRRAASRLDLPPLRSPWLPPLPTRIAPDELPSAPPQALSIGLLDLPCQQAQVAYALPLGRGHLLIAGGPGSGRTTVLRTVAGAVAAGTAVADVHLYALDGPAAGLAAVAQLPHTGAVVGREELERGDRLISRLVQEIARRQRVLTTGGHMSVVEQRATAKAGDWLPWIVLLVDGWEGLVSAYDRVDGGRPVETLLRLLQEGPAAGLNAVITGDRSVLTGRLPSLVADRLILAMADPMEYALAGLAPRHVPESLPPGRGLVPGEPPVEAQVAVLAGDPAGPAQVVELTRLAGAAIARAGETPASQQPLRVGSLPAELSYADAAAQAVPMAAEPLWGLLGVGGDDLGAIGVDLAGDGPALLVTGPAGSGRSTVLVTLARWYADQGIPVIVVAPKRSPARGCPGSRRDFGPADCNELVRFLAGVDGPLVVLVDDAEAIVDAPVEPVLCDVLRAGADRPWAMAIAGSTEALATTYRGITVDARKHRVGLILRPRGPLDGDVLGVALPRGLDTRPGRGLLVVRGALTAVQVAR